MRSATLTQSTTPRKAISASVSAPCSTQAGCLYTHTSDLHSVYATQAISCAPREARYVLSGILDNDSTLVIREHTSDTHGFTEHLFDLCALLGIAFMPRLKDLPYQVLSRIDATRRTS